MYFKKVQRIGEVLSTDLRKIVGAESAKGLDAVHAIDTWRKMLGPTMVRYSEGETFENGALKVRIKSAVLRNDLFMQRTELIQKLNTPKLIPKNAKHAITKLITSTIAKEILLLAARPAFLGTSSPNTKVK